MLETEYSSLLPLATIGTDEYCRRFMHLSSRPAIRLSIRLSVPNDVTTLTLSGFQMIRSRFLDQMAMLGQYLHVSWNFVIFYDRLGSGLRDDITTRHCINST